MLRLVRKPVFRIFITVGKRLAHNGPCCWMTKMMPEILETPGSVVTPGKNENFLTCWKDVNQSRRRRRQLRQPVNCFEVFSIVVFSSCCLRTENVVSHVGHSLPFLSLPCLMSCIHLHFSRCCAASHPHTLPHTVSLPGMSSLLVCSPSGPRSRVSPLVILLPVRSSSCGHSSFPPCHAVFNYLKCLEFGTGVQEGG